MVEKSCNLRNEHGILCDPPPNRKEKVISENQKAEFLQEYENHIRICLGKGDTKSMRQTDGSRNNIYSKYKKSCKYPSIGKSAFAA